MDEHEECTCGHPLSVHSKQDLTCCILQCARKRTGFVSLADYRKTHPKSKVPWRHKTLGGRG